jgi:hypothetical protein
VVPVLESSISFYQACKLWHFQSRPLPIFRQDELDGFLVTAGQARSCAATTVSHRRRKSGILQDVWSSDKSGAEIENLLGTADTCAKILENNNKSPVQTPSNTVQIGAEIES